MEVLPVENAFVDRLAKKKASRGVLQEGCTRQRRDFLLGSGRPVFVTTHLVVTLTWLSAWLSHDFLQDCYSLRPQEGLESNRIESNRINQTESRQQPRVVPQQKPTNLFSATQRRPTIDNVPILQYSCGRCAVLSSCCVSIVVSSSSVGVNGSISNSSRKHNTVP